MAKTKKTLKIDPVGFHKVIKLLEAQEKEGINLMIKDKPVSNFLHSISDAETSKASVSAQVKMAILKTNGENNPDPSKLPDDTKMADFGFSEIQLIKLADRFRKIVQQTNPGGDITPVDIEGCETVGDCIDLVVKATD